MKSYLGLVSEYAKAHRRKNRLTVICIAISVMLVTAIFGMADMSIKAQINETIRLYGNFHAIVSGISDSAAQEISSRGDVLASSFLGMAGDTVYRGKELLVQSCSAEFAPQMNLNVAEGRYPASPQEALLDKQALAQFGIALGDTIEITFAGGQKRAYAITGTYRDFSSLKGRDAHGLMLSPEGMRALPSDQYQEYSYIQFKSGADINGALSEIKADYALTDAQVSPNRQLLGLMGQSSDNAIQQVYLTAGILFVLVTMAGTFMIASSFNMSIQERTQFFGLLRCLGATKRQVKRYIRLEGLRYCLKGVPLGLFSGCAVLWASIFFLNSLNSQYLPPMPMFQVSWPGIAAGAAIGVLVIMIASNSPARQAAKVSPQAAVTGNINHTDNHRVNRASNTKRFSVDTAMGLRHAFSNKKNMLLISGSFAISIILFLCFTTLITFMNSALTPLKPYAPDLTVKGAQESALLDRSLMEEMRGLPHIKTLYGRMFLENIPAEDEQGQSTATLISYDEPQFQWAKELLVSGDLQDVKNGKGVLVDYGYSEEYNWSPGDTITLIIAGEPRAVEVAAIVSDVPFDGGWIFVCSESKFTELTGISDYTVIDMQVEQDISAQVRTLIGAEMQLLDNQQRNSEIRSNYYAVAVFVYGFLLVIGLVALINIVNTINASVSSRIAGYGMMRAVGMSARQLKRVIRTEAAAYAFTGSIAGSVLGLFLHRFFFGLLITSNWGQPWEPPLTILAATIAASILAALISVSAPAKKIEKTQIVNVVNAQ